MGRAIGIDLGTTNSVAAIRIREPRVLQNSESEDLTPSVVSVYRNQLRVGRLALDYVPLAPKDTIISVKRLMGRAFRDEHVQEVRGKYAYEVVEPADGTEEDVRVVMSGKQYSPVEISVEILKKIKKDAEMRLNDTVESAVITVPAYFTDKQKEATRRAGQLAGLKVQKILDEPTAAAIAFGVDNVGPDDSKTILVYDLGGGTFDVSVLTVVGGIFAQLDTEGNMWLGGDDFDHKIMDHVIQHIKAVHGVDARKDLTFMAELKKKAEKAKIALSTMTRADIALPGMLKDEEDNLVEVELDLSRADFQRMIARDVESSVELVWTAIRNAGEMMTPEQIDHVILVGGSSYIPLVRESLAKIFGREKVLANVDPMKCVAFGAALLAAKLIGQVECPRGHMNSETSAVCQTEGCGLPVGAPGGGPIEHLGGQTPIHYGIQAQGDRFEIIIPKNTPFPMLEPVKERFYTPSANLKRLRVPIYAGFDPVASRNELQATVWLELPDGVPEDTPLEVAFSLDGDGILDRVRVALLDGSGTQVETYLDRGNVKRSRLERKLEQLKKDKDQMRDELQPEGRRQFEDLYAEAIRALNRNDEAGAEGLVQQGEALLQKSRIPTDWRRRAENLCGYAEFLLSQYGWLIDPPATQRLKSLVADVRRALAADDPVAGEAAVERLDKATDVKTDERTEALVPPPVGLCLVFARAAAMAHQKGLELEAEQMKSALREIESHMRQGDFSAALQTAQRHDETLKRIFGAAATDSKVGVEDLVRAAR